ncbi:MAG: hypothetical protein WDN04_16555 [Rhodospirillales bacterium]
MARIESDARIAAAAVLWPPAQDGAAAQRHFALGLLLSLSLHVAVLTAFHARLEQPDWQAISPGLAWLTVTLRPLLPRQTESAASATGEARSAAKPPQARPHPEQKRAVAPSVNNALPESAPVNPPNAGASPEQATAAPARSIDLDAARSLARESSRSRTGVLSRDLPNLAPARPDYESPLAKAIARSARPDCRSEYAGMGIFAIPFLLKDTITDSGCKW